MEPSLVISIISLVVSGVSLVVSIGVLIRSFYLERPNLLFIHSQDESEQSFVRTDSAQVIGTSTVIISNNSSRANAVIAWAATVRDAEGNQRDVPMLRTTLGDYPEMNVTPTVIPAFTAVEAHLFFGVDVRTLPNPVVFQVRATDRVQKTYAISISIPNRLRNTLMGN